MDAGEINLAEFDIPLPLQECPDGLEGFKLVTGRACFAKKFTAGPVPIQVEMELAPEAKLSFGAELDSETLEPAAVVKPSIGLGLEIKGGPGGDVGPLELFGGVMGNITLIEVAFPVKFGIGFEKATTLVGAQSQVVQDLWIVSKVISTELELTFLQLALSLFFEAGAGPFKFSVSWEFFSWDGITLTWQLSESKVYQYKVDFLFALFDPTHSSTSSLGSKP